MTNEGKRRVGFASMPPAKRRELASKGGKLATRRHAFTHDEAVAAGKKGAANRKKPEEEKP